MVVAGAAGGRTQRQTSRDAEEVLGAAVREDRRDAALRARSWSTGWPAACPRPPACVTSRRTATAPAPARTRLPGRHSRRWTGSPRRCIGRRRCGRRGRWTAAAEMAACISAGAALVTWAAVVDPADVPMMRSASVRSSPASARPARTPISQALPVRPAPRTGARSVAVVDGERGIAEGVVSRGVASRELPSPVLPVTTTCVARSWTVGEPPTRAPCDTSWSRSGCRCRAGCR
ncbi:MAG: hypothetical protein JWR33_2042 [Naasia sp.]|nr:hypothetical protein [Naasia sp.]